MRAGFSLIEVALALLVVSIGLVAAVGMLPGSLDNSKRASDDTQAALFADYVLNSLRTLASATNVAVTRWGDINSSGPSIPIAAPDMWDQGSSMTIQPGGGIKTLVFRPKADKDIEEMTLAYEFTISDLVPDVSKRAELKVWINSQRNTNTLQRYYAYLYRGDFPK